MMLWISLIQWRRQTIKSGSAFKGQLYFQVGQMEGLKVPSDLREAWNAGVSRRSTEEDGFGEGRRSHSQFGGLWAMPQKKIQKSTFKSRVFCIFANWKSLICSVGKAISLRH